ncbi:MAG: PD-(D/E)XK nuclease family protein, partial [Bacteroidales bacterium]|nr:PD-(D/E)XK nuclease family protein [Bacteroidales bacterium]
VSADLFTPIDNPLLSLIFKPIDNVGAYLEDVLSMLLGESGEDDEAERGEVLTKIEHEYTYHYLNIVSRLNDVIASHPDVNIATSTYFALLGKLSLSIPFDGEPLSGLQVMGVLETRALDFDNIIILSMNEGTFPKKQVAASFIPYNLRRGYNMATTEHQDSIYAYYFYRMIARAKQVFMLYDSRTEGLKRGEMSRFVYQLKYHYAHILPEYKVEENAVAHSISIEKPSFISIPKVGGVAERLQQFLKGADTPRSLSASALKTYINCPLQFYMQHVEGLKVDNDISESVDSSIFGNIYHNVMATIYNNLKRDYGATTDNGQRVVNVTQSMLEDVMNDDSAIKELIAREFNVQFYHATKDAPMPQLSGRNSIIAHMVYIYIMKTLEYDCQEFAPFVYHNSEEKLDGDLFLPLNNGKEVRFKAYIDRVDYVGDKLRIIDYKTGSDEVAVASFDMLFDKNCTKKVGAIIQVLLYCKLYTIAHPECKSPIHPLIYSVRKAFSDLAPNLKVGNQVLSYDDVSEEYEQRLLAVLQEMFDEEKPFTQTQELKHCTYCDFKTICKRN